MKMRLSFVYKGALIDVSVPKGQTMKTTLDVVADVLELDANADYRAIDAFTHVEFDVERSYESQAIYEATLIELILAGE